MKKLLLFLIFGACFLGVNAQGGGNANASWNLIGNGGTTTRNFLGTTDTMPLIFKTNGIEWLRLLPNGYFGIGTDQPQEKLHIEDGGILVSKRLTGASNFSNIFGIRLKDQNMSELIWGLNFLSANGSSGLELSFSTTPFMPACPSLLFLGIGGSVGIGNTNPQEKLDVSGVMRAQSAKIAGNNLPNGFDISYTNTNLFLKQQEQGKFFIEGPGGGLMIDPNGNIGVGKNPPTAKLDVNGSFKAQNANIAGTLTTNNLSIDGNLGLGTNDPQAKLHVHEGDILISTTEGKVPGEGGFIYFEKQPNVFGPGWAIGYTDFNDNYGLKFWKPWNPYMQHVLFLSDVGDIGIGTDKPKQKLHIVDGNILISKTSGRDTDAPQSPNGSILFGPDVNDSNPMGRWGIEYLNGEDDAYGLNFWRPWNPGTGSGYNYALFLGNNNYVGIGTKNPTAKLDIAGALKATNATLSGGLTAQSATISGNTYISGNLGIGVNPTTKLDVKGTIRAEEVKVCLSQGCDFVFNEDYELMSLNDLENFIKTNKHLPNVAPAAEMEAEGINLSEMNAILIQKIEELTLYILDLQKQINELKQTK